MKKKWVSRSGKPTCILFFNGWGMDEQVLSGMIHGEYDVCLFDEYNVLEPLHSNEFQYENIIVLAWSLGVCAANAVLAKSNLKINSSIAINGTPWPWHDELAIPQSIFQQTLNGWNERNRFKFNLRMFGGKSQLEEAEQFLSKRSIENQKHELQFFDTLGNDFTPEEFSWDLVLIGLNDRIVPPENQLRFWHGKAEVNQKNWSHFPFGEFSNLNELIKG
ncbi:MAG TPA: pimeloyl-ACP methyl esterase BioG family protein [Sunxiuqinia sp.]|nr:pimeloyl-ACP methyl esterase BioG family protein [Sunxiuqinia sp.]